jgi:hypothetical protein
MLHYCQNQINEFSQNEEEYKINEWATFLASYQSMHGTHSSTKTVIYKTTISWEHVYVVRAYTDQILPTCL